MELYNTSKEKSHLVITKFSMLYSFSGIIKGDEIMVINGAIVSDLDMMFIESVLQEEISLCMMMRSSRTGTRESSIGKSLSNAVSFLPV